MSRLPPVPGEWIDRSRGLQFTFEGARIDAFEGDTISSALLAAGRTVLGRSFKYHRPRGPLSVANHDVNLVMQVEEGSRSTPNVRADVAPARAGISVRTVNTRGGVERDRGAFLDRLSPFLPVGFYYKAFHTKRLFPLWERLIRSMAGLGAVDLEAPRLESPKRYDFADVLVVGGGPSGLSAALAAADRGAEVLLVDENQRLGGSGHYVRSDPSAQAVLVALVRAAASHPRIRVQCGTFAAGYYADHWVPLATPDCLVKVRARAVVVAQGAFEQPAVFRGNDLPGVLLASGAQRLMARYGVGVATRLAILTANAAGYRAALDAIGAGVQVEAVLDLRPTLGPESQQLANDVRNRGVRVVMGARPYQARAGREAGVARFEFEHLAGNGRRQSIAVDGLWMSVGFAPANSLLLQAGTRMRYERACEQFVPEALPAGLYACGKVNGHYGFHAACGDGERAGALAAVGLGLGSAVPDAALVDSAESPTHAFPIFRHPKGKEFVDFDEDLHVRDFENAVQEGFDGSELLKRYTTVGMGPSQGKHSNLNALRLLAKLRGQDISGIAPTTARPMFHPVPLAQLAGRGFVPERCTPVDEQHAKLGAVWMPAGQWRRPAYYARPGLDRAAAIADEVDAVRNRVGLIDVGTLGKVEAHGPDAAEFLERVYTGRFSNLAIGMTRYGLMLDESGVVIDDGVIARLEPARFYFTTTTGNSGTLFREFGRLVIWWGLQVGLVNLTGHYAAFNLAGPASRKVLRALTTLDLSQAAFPYLGVREAEVAGVRCRLLRVGFVGELGYEIHLPADSAIHLWQTLLATGERFGIRPFGVEAQRHLRLEKGHVIVGQDTDGLTNPFEIGCEWALKRNKAFFVGQRSLDVLERQPRRHQLVGFRLKQGQVTLPKECHLVVDEGTIAGRVTSVVYSPTLGYAIGLAFVSPSLVARGRFRIRVEERVELDAEIVPAPFYDPTGERQRLEDPT